jgi:hypothetical protein
MSEGPRVGTPQEADVVVRTTSRGFRVLPDPAGRHTQEPREIFLDDGYSDT